MKHGSDDVPVACCLTNAELREREATLLAQFRSAVIETEELRDGYAFRECCPFLTFELVAQPNMGSVIVSVTGPAGAKEFLRTVL
jgi:hypothetical protein